MIVKYHKYKKIKNAQIANYILQIYEIILICKKM